MGSELLSRGKRFNPSVLEEDILVKRNAEERTRLTANDGRNSNTHILHTQIHRAEHAKIRANAGLIQLQLAGDEFGTGGRRKSRAPDLSSQSILAHLVKLHADG